MARSASKVCNKDCVPASHYSESFFGVNNNPHSTKLSQRPILSHIMPEIASQGIPAAETVQYQHARVIIVGAGPVGLFLALKLSSQGVDVLVLEALADVLQSPRATTLVKLYRPHGSLH